MIRQRCAIYTRKSTEEGLDQSFNSLDAQREACAAYILSQRHEGWNELPDRYDDGGFSGGSMDRPGLQQLLDDVRAGRVDVVVVYKVDRLTRALSDFAKMVEVFDSAGVSFVSVTQAFNTTSSMGRLTLNVLLSFAQFEREVTAERIRDKVAASKRKGLWMGGGVPMGYDARDKSLVVNEEEAGAVRKIYAEYLALGSVPALIRRLGDLGITSRMRTDRFGRVTGGAAFSRGALYQLLRNPTYIGKTRHRGAIYEGQHAAIVAEETWRQVQALLDSNDGREISVRRRTVRRWLDGILFDARGWPMRTTYSLKAQPGISGKAMKRYWYYYSKPDIASGREKGERLPAQPIEAAILSAVSAALSDQSWLVRSTTDPTTGAVEIGSIIEHAQDLVSGLAGESEDAAGTLLAPLVMRVDMMPGILKAQIDLRALLDQSSDRCPLDAHLDIPFTVHQNGRARPIVMHTAGGEPRRDPELISLVADARRWREELLDGQTATIAEINKREGLPNGTVSRILTLAWLAPDITAAILEGRQPANLSPARLRNLPDLPVGWTDQRELLGFPAI